MSTLIVSLDDESLLALHARLDSDGPDDPAAVEAHHTVTTEMARRGIEHGHDGDAWSQAVILVESVEVDGPDAIEAPEELQKTWNATLSDGGTVSVLLTVDGYVLKADPTVSDVHVDTIMGGGRRRKLTKTEWKVGDFASWQSSGGTARGKILRIVRSGKINVPDSSFTISADEDDPAVLLEVWRRGPEGWAATDTKVGHKASTLTKLESLAKADGYTVPSGVQAAARQALKWIADGRAGDGFTSVGRARARQLADGGSVSRETLVKMRAYFARHIVDKEAKGWGDRSNPTPGMVAWYAWGGDAGRAWANRVLADDPVEKRATPEAILDLHVNLKNRQHAIDEYLYGPLNPDAPGNYWERLGAVWGVSAEEAQTTRCGNCAAFNVSPEILDAIGDAIDPEEGDDVVEAADLGYCEVFKFKCAAARSCSAWLTGGPIGREDDEDEIGFLESLTDEDKDWYAQISVRLDSGEDMDGVLLKRGNPEALRDYWRAGGKGRISWGAGGDFTSCVAAVGKYMTSEQAKGYCAIRHREVTGMWPGDKRNRETKKSVGYHTLTFPDGTTYSFTAAEPVLKHPGHPDQKVHAGRSASLSPEVARSIIERTRVNGGLSVNMVDGSEPPKGYMVARGGTRGVKPAIVDAEDFYDPVKGPQVLGDFLVTNRDTLTRGDYLGVWHDKQSGKVFLDVSENVMDRETAVRRGKRRDQISIWDVVNAEEIDTGGTGQIAEKSTDSSGTTAEFRRDDGGRDSSVRADSLGEVSGQSVAKHGSHDQASHGRRGGGAATVPKMQADGPISSDRSTAAVSEAKALRAKAEAMEPAVTSMVLDRVSAYGGEMTGLEYRLKSTDSLARKIDADAVKEHDGDRTKAAGAVSDAIRYTATFDEDNYTDGVASTLGSLEADGYSVRAKNFWQPGDPYQGMNVKATKDGVTIELQFHTRNSVKIKEEKLHPLYEDYRSSTNNRDRWKAWDRMTRIAEGIPRPRDYERLLSIGTLTLQQFETAQQAGVMG